MKKIEELTNEEKSALNEEMAILRDWLDGFEDAVEEGAHSPEKENRGWYGIW